MVLLQELYANGILSDSRKEELEKEILNTGKKEEEVILGQKIISEDALFELKSRILRIPLEKIKPEDISSDVLELIPEEASANYKMISFSKTKDFVQVAMVYPEDISAQNALRFLASQEKFNYQVYLITPGNFIELQKQRKTIGAEAKKVLEELNKEKEDILGTLSQKISPSEIITDDAPIIKMVLAIIRHAIEAKASDIHIEPGREKLNIRFRINGVLKSDLLLPLKVHPSIAARIKILSGLKIDENRIPQDGRFSARINDRDLDFRVATFPTLYGEKIELRVLDPSAGSKTFDDLGLTGKNLELVKDAIKKPYGLILFTGPTGSGKTTTQYAILRILNQEGVNIVTVEDPIEYSISGINQSQIKPEIGYTFASGLRQILRQDPNIIMVGEVRDEETASLVMNAALTGHVVLSTLHTNSSVGVVARLMDMGVRSFLIPSTLRIVISQRLVRTLCNNCKIKTKPSLKVKDFILDKIKDLPEHARVNLKIPDPLFIYSAKGCDQCKNTGYSGRAGLFEVFSMNDQIAQLILKDPTEQSIFKEAVNQGMVTMEQEGILKVLSGQTSMEEITRVTTER
jgi:type IV pilus assembly protein PilB